MPEGCPHCSSLPRALRRCSESPGYCPEPSPSRLTSKPSPALLLPEIGPRTCLRQARRLHPLTGCLCLCLWLWLRLRLRPWP